MYADVTASAEHHRYQGIVDRLTIPAGIVATTRFMRPSLAYGLPSISSLIFLRLDAGTSRSRRPSSRARLHGVETVNGAEPAACFDEPKVHYREGTIQWAVLQGDHVVEDEASLIQLRSVFFITT